MNAVERLRDRVQRTRGRVGLVRRIRAALDDAVEPMSSNELAIIVGEPEDAVLDVLRWMSRRGLVNEH